MKALTLAVLLSVLLVGCHSEDAAKVTTSHDWSYSEIESAIDIFRKKEASAGREVPKKIRSIQPTGKDALKVYLSDYEALSGYGLELTLEKAPKSGWVVVASQFFDQ